MRFKILATSRLNRVGWPGRLEKCCLPLTGGPTARASFCERRSRSTAEFHDGGLNFSECLIYSFNYADIKKNNENNDWDSTFNMLLKGCNFLKAGGAEAIVLCANTMHFIADRLEKEIKLPIIHIATETAKEIQQQNLKK